MVTNTRITHATPAAAYGHSAHRDWECDSKIPEVERSKGCKDLARQLVEDEPGKNINVSWIKGEKREINIFFVCGWASICLHFTGNLIKMLRTKKGNW